MPSASADQPSEAITLLDEKSGRVQGQVFGDVGQWVWQVPWAWQQLAFPGQSPSPAPPVDEKGDDPFWDDLAARAAHWSPLIHLLTAGLGWRDPVKGLDLWAQVGYPRTDPILDFVARHWGERDIEWFNAGLVGNHSIVGRLPQLDAELIRRKSPRLLAPTVLSAGVDTSAPQWQLLWGGGYDPLHLGHALKPLERPAAPVTVLLSPMFTGSDGRPDRLLHLDRYDGWCFVLHSLGIEGRVGEHDVRVHVVVEQVGSLGVYRRSAVTGRWFRGKHSTHQVGS